ncbi:hypothetical protein CDL15_Pgr018662 [Punica granatum]|uniref:Uncharacterized protein n=1 Tax=Punica granatum TaxID=22663 RepID=A0A218WZK3_PUNGR|nr:hypothetical protein CDL15_Pgr018662 [Punica granatum]
MKGQSPKAVNVRPKPNIGLKPNAVNAGPEPNAVNAEPEPDAGSKPNAVNARPEPDAVNAGPEPNAVNACSIRKCKKCKNKALGPRLVLPWRKGEGREWPARKSGHDSPDVQGWWPGWTRLLFTTHLAIEK